MSNEPERLDQDAITQAWIRATNTVARLYLNNPTTIQFEASYAAEVCRTLSAAFQAGYANTCVAELQRKMHDRMSRIGSTLVGVLVAMFLAAAAACDSDEGAQPYDVGTAPGVDDVGEQLDDDDDDDSSSTGDDDDDSSSTGDDDDDDSSSTGDDDDDDEPSSGDATECPKDSLLVNGWCWWYGANGESCGVICSYHGAYVPHAARNTTESVAALFYPGYTLRFGWLPQEVVKVQYHEIFAPNGELGDGSEALNDAVSVCACTEGQP